MSGKGEVETLEEETLDLVPNNLHPGGKGAQYFLESK